MQTPNRFSSSLEVNPLTTADAINQAFPESPHLSTWRKIADKFRPIQAIANQCQRQAPSPTGKLTEEMSPNSQSVCAEQLYHQAILSVEQGYVQGAIAALSLAISLQPNYAEAYRYRGHLHALLGAEYQAAIDLAKAVVLTPGRPGGKISLSKT